MSDPVTNVEIEDVLSSIRRLVSESGGEAEARRDEGADDAQDEAPKASASAEPDGTSEPETQDAPAAEDAPIGKLVLTPSLRIADEAETAPEDAPEDVPEDALADTEACHDESESAQPVAAEAETAPSDAQAEPAEESVTETPPETGAEAAGEALKSRIEALEEAVSEQDGDWEDEGDAEEDITETLNWEDHTAEPAGAVHDLPPFVAGAAHDVTPEAETAEAESSEEPFDFLGSGDDAVLDEETLREMVSEIVRQELQGALGERITRNVRKLVRREIHRVLMSQELD